MEGQEKIAILIDAENISMKYMKLIMNEVGKYGIATYKRIYGDFSNPGVMAWQDKLREYAMTPIFQFNYTRGKNASDSALIIDAMDILYANNVDGFIIVSSDSDFTRLAMRLREAGKRVVGMGESKTPTPFVRACEQFKTLDVLYKNHHPEQKNNYPERIRKQNIKCITPEKALLKDIQPKDAQPITNLRAIKATVISLLEENSDEDGWMYLSELGNMIQKMYSDFDCRNYGFPKFGKLIESFPELQTRKDDSSNGITKIVLVRRRED